MVCPEFSPRPIATSAFRVMGQSQTSPLAAPFLAAGTVTEIWSPTIDRLTGSDSAPGSLRVFDRGLVAAEYMLHAVHDNLRRVNLAIAARLRVRTLAVGVTRQRERVLPTEIIPVVDRQAQNDERGIARELPRELVCRRARRAALAGEQLNHAARLGGGNGRRQHGGSDRC